MELAHVVENLCDNIVGLSLILTVPMHYHLRMSTPWRTHSDVWLMMASKTATAPGHWPSLGTGCSLMKFGPLMKALIAKSGMDRSYTNNHVDCRLQTKPVDPDLTRVANGRDLFYDPISSSAEENADKLEIDDKISRMKLVMMDNMILGLLVQNFWYHRRSCSSGGHQQVCGYGLWPVSEPLVKPVNQWTCNLVLEFFIRQVALM